ncbi:MAG: FtsX-like permease family protein [Chloroflexi bacterium]|nr:FtsX-like permease family protein [Chloroflexota bacterium]
MANKLRSVLTTLGIVIGVSAVIFLVSVGQGVRNSVAQQFEQIGSTIMFVIPGKLEATNTNMRSNFLRSANTSTLTYADALQLKEQAWSLGLRDVAPEFVATGLVVLGNRNRQTSISGATADYPTVREFAVAKGRFLDENDLRSLAKVAVLGRKVYLELFPTGEDPIDATLRINGVPFRVIGVMEAKGGTAFNDEDDQVFVPLTTAQVRLFGGRTASGDYTVSVIYARARDEASLDRARDKVSQLLRRRHNLLYRDDEDDFSVLTQKDISSVLDSLFALLTVFLGLIATVSLIVGGIGIMNIMLVSVTERTREIGIRKAVGAKRRDILAQFLFEAMVLSLLGGLLGIVAGISGLGLATRFSSSLSFSLSLSTVLIATGFSVAVGLFFGFYPALRASRLNPIDALRYE